MKTSLLVLWLSLVGVAADSKWTTREAQNPDSPGKALFIEYAGKPVALFVYGPGQMKPFLHVYGEEGELLTNGGLDSKGQPVGQFPHHRGIFVGWKINSDLGSFDLWHMNNGGLMEVRSIEKPAISNDQLTIVANIDWRAGKTDASGNDLLLKEKRRMTFSKPDDKALQIDLGMDLEASRKIMLAGDLQHSGVHFRAANEVAEKRSEETAYLTEPENKPKGADLKWCQLTFPIGNRWYKVTQLNSPKNPVEELSTRAYGRFGYFFKKGLEERDALKLNYRFIVESATAPTPEMVAAERKRVQALYEASLQPKAQAKRRAE